jgi:ribosome-binding factor A
MAGLKSATGFLQSRVAARLQTRFTPALTFRLDDSVKKSISISKLIDEALATDRQHEAGHPASSERLTVEDDEPEHP